MFVVFHKAEVVLAHVLIRPGELVQLSEGLLRFLVGEVLREDVLEAHFGVLQEVQLFDESEVVCHALVQAAVKLSGQFCVAVPLYWVAAVEGVHQGLGVVG